MKKNIKDILIGTFFLIWFVCSIISMLYLSKINKYYTIMIFGQYFFVFGLIPLKVAVGKEKLMSVPFILIGLCCVIIPYLMMNPDLLSVSLNWDHIIPLLLILVFVLAGIAMTLLPIINKNKLKKVCTMTVNAKIIKYDHIYGDNGRKLYCPIYAFEFNGNKYEVSNNKYSNFGNKQIESIINLKINPNNPNEFIDERVFDNFVIILGIIFLIASVPIFLYMINTIDFIK